MRPSTIDLIVVIADAIGIFALAQWVSRDKGGHAKNSTDCFLASKNLPWWPAAWGGIAALNAVPFLNRMLIVFFLALGLAAIVSFARPAAATRNRITMQGVSFRTTAGFNLAAAVIIAILVVLYTVWW